MSAAAQPVTASFTADPTTGPVPLTVNFSSTSTGTIQSLAWDFNGDTQPDDTNLTTSFTYNEAGTYNVTLTVTGADNQTSQTSQTITVTNAGPTPRMAIRRSRTTCAGVSSSASAFSICSATAGSSSWKIYSQQEKSRHHQRRSGQNIEYRIQPARFTGKLI